MNSRYRKMLKGMASRKRKRKELWYLYILECGDGSFYTGITKNIEERLKKHNDGKGSAYTRTHRPVKLIYQEPCSDRSSALIREMKVKSLSRKEKEKLVSRELAIQKYAEGKATLNQSAESMGVSIVKFLKELKRKGIKLNYDSSELQKDLKTIKKIQRISPNP